MYSLTSFLSKTELESRTIPLLLLASIERVMSEVKHQPARDAILVSLSRCVPVAGQGETRVINIQPKSSHRELGSPEAVTLRFHDAHLANAFLKKLKAEQERLAKVGQICFVRSECTRTNNADEVLPA